MRIKLNITQLTPDENPSVYWLHVDLTRILLIKQLKKKVQNVLKESRDIELCFENVPFLDEDDITAINENEEITVIVKERINCTKTNCTKSDSSIEFFNSGASVENAFKPVVYEQNLTPKLQDSISRKRSRKRIHKKKDQSELPAPINNGCLDSVPVYMPSCDESNKVHKRFILEDVEDNKINISSSSDESVHVVREIIRCNSPFPNSTKNNVTQPSVQKQKPFRSTKIIKVPVFERIKKCTANNTTQNGVNTLNEMGENNLSENYDMMVVDWKNMTPSKISDISELRVYDLIQFKVLTMNENGEPEMSSVITARLEVINGHLLFIQVLSGIKEFLMCFIPKFQIEDEEDLETCREVLYNDLYEVHKLT